jgi:thiol:disulfide interchange protein DsbD
MLKRLAIFLISFYLISAVSAYAEDVIPFESQHSGKPVNASILAEHETIQPGQHFWIAIHLTLDDKWHAYWKNPGDAGMAPTIEWKLPEGYAAVEVLWPAPKRFTINESVSFVYEDEVLLLAKITAPERASGHTEIAADIRWVVCDDSSCLPGNAELSTTIPVSEKTPLPNAKHSEVFSKARSKIPQPHASASAKKADGLITLKVDAIDEIIEANFFPETADRVDHTVDAVVTKGMQPNQYHVILRETENADADAPLKGVVVLKIAGSVECTVAYDVNLPVLSSSAADVAFRTDTTKVNETVEYGSNAPQFEGGFLLALVFAFAGGLLLNLMPCVFPVISFKALSFVKLAGENRSLVFKHGIAFSLGVLVSFWVLAGILLGMQAYGHSVGWGFQLQQPLFVAILASVILLFGLSMFGLFEMGAGFASKAGQAQVSNKASGLASSFFSGILATAVATPCTGPFLGTAVGFAVTLPPFLAMIVFTTLGLGMAAPYLLLGACPGLLKFVPRPGKWMITFKEIMGFVMMATVLWLLWVFATQTDAFAVWQLLIGFFFMAIGCWIYGKWGTPANKKIVRTFSYVYAAAFLMLGGYFVLLPSLNAAKDNELIALADNAGHESKWEPFSPQRVEELRKKGIPVFIDFTAKWCLICQANHLVLSVDSVEKKFDELGVVRMKADWTKSNPVITEELKKYGRNSVPLYLLYDGSSSVSAAILPQVLTPDIVLDHLSKIHKPIADEQLKIPE